MDIHSRTSGSGEDGALDTARQGDVALLIDWENLKWGLRFHFRAAPNITSVIAAAATISTLLQSAADKILVYERDVEPLEVQPIIPVEQARSIEDAMTRLGQLLPPFLAAQRTKLSFTALNESLLTRYGFNARD